MALYRIKKIKSNHIERDYDDYILCGTLAVGKRPYPEALEAARNDVLDYDGPVWEKQELIRPTLNARYLFVSCRPDAGWYNMSPVDSYIVHDNGDVEITTQNSVYLCELEKEE
jgi:hypothetical protein